VASSTVLPVLITSRMEISLLESPGAYSSL
jgi:hypothetical protein